MMTETLYTLTVFTPAAWLCRSGYLPGSVVTMPAIPKRITIAQIQSKVAEHFLIPRREMVSDRRSQQVARPRQVAMYLSRQLTPRSLPQIGRAFGDRDHTTVIHAIRQVEKRLATDHELAAQIIDLTKALEAA